MAWVALAVVGALGAALSYVSGWEFGELPAKSYPTLAAEALRYNRTNVPSTGEILLLGSSLMRLGVLEDQLAGELGQSGARVINLAMDGAGPWEQLRLLHRLDSSRASGFRVAILEVNRESFDVRSAATQSAYAPRMAMSSPRAGGSSSGLASKVYLAVVPPRQGIEDWVQEIRFGFLGRRFPDLVQTPAAPRRRLWDVDAETQRRAVRAMTPEVAARALHGWRLSHGELTAFRRLIAELQGRGYRVVILQTPVHAAYLAAWMRPEDTVAERAWRDSILVLSSSGADAVLALDDAASLGATDSVFIDYAHMDHDGASLQTQVVFRFLEESHLLNPQSASVRSPTMKPGPPASHAARVDSSGQGRGFFSSR